MNGRQQLRATLFAIKTEAKKYVDSTHQLNALAFEGASRALDLLVASSAQGDKTKHRQKAARWIAQIKGDGTGLKELKAMATELFESIKHQEQFLTFAQGCYDSSLVVREYETAAQTTPSALSR